MAAVLSTAGGEAPRRSGGVTSCVVVQRGSRLVKVIIVVIEIRLITERIPLNPYTQHTIKIFAKHANQINGIHQSFIIYKINCIMLVLIGCF